MPRAVNNYFDNLQKGLEQTVPDKILNYNKTNITAKPGSETIIACSEKNRVEGKTYHSKSSNSVMLCGNAIEHFLPPVVVYNQKMYRRWTKWNSFCCNQKWMVQ